MTRYGLVLLLLVSGCDDDIAPPADGGQDQSVGDMTGGGSDGGGPTAARGEYLVKHLLMCGDCHSTPDNMGQPDPNKFLAGGRTFPVPGFGPDGGVGLVYAKNLTNDATGLSSWSESQIVDALTVGVDDQGEPRGDLAPVAEIVFPFDQDLQARSAAAGTGPSAVEALRGTPIVRQAGPVVEERYTVDPAGIVSVTITDTGTGYRQEHLLHA